ncbi:MAG: hypothetical protein IKO27_00635 [Ruminococcus sp.]|nr:hypothetical protein [Ruminococcus sp.]
MTIIFEVLFELFKKLYRFAGPALFMIIILIAEIITVPNIADNRAAAEARHLESNKVVSFEETGYDEESMDRVFRAVLRNTGAAPSGVGTLYITDEQGDPIYNTVRTEYHDLRICGNNVTIYSLPPGCEAVVEVRIDDYKLEGLDHIYITDDYSDKSRGTRFGIEKK